ncbi:MAG: hypothetical protein UY63_C0012G0012 [Parcubacteria group bacterium GW2011_GWA2_51_10]|nr:MAG: hypothetical protein UY63_C0012G0012 [Parcubacteria group bacterium GW2011_GWA2_51_10]
MRMRPSQYAAIGSRSPPHPELIPIRPPVGLGACGFLILREENAALVGYCGGHLYLLAMHENGRLMRIPLPHMYAIGCLDPNGFALAWSGLGIETPMEHRPAIQNFFWNNSSIIRELHCEWQQRK